MIKILLKLILFVPALFLSFNLTAREATYACTDWELERPEYETPSFTKKMGEPFTASKKNNYFYIKDTVGEDIILDYVGMYNTGIDIYKSYNAKYKSTGIIYVRYLSAKKNKIVIKDLMYDTRWAYFSTCKKTN